VRSCKNAIQSKTSHDSQSVVIVFLVLDCFVLLILAHCFFLNIQINGTGVCKVHTYLINPNLKCQTTKQTIIFLLNIINLFFIHGNNMIET
jgi:hypothetical protein